jgi:hypothetical protein
MDGEDFEETGIELVKHFAKSLVKPFRPEQLHDAHARREQERRKASAESLGSLGKSLNEKGSSGAIHQKNTGNRGHAGVIEMPAHPPLMPDIPVDEVMSFLRQTKSALTWSEREMADALHISQVEARRVIDLMTLQGYVKRSAVYNQWMTTIDGEAVSGSKPPRFARERVEKAITEFKKRIAAVNEDKSAVFHIVDAVAFGDFLLEVPRVQAAEVGVRFISVSRASAVDQTANRGRQFLRQMRGKGGLLQLQTYQPWMSRRSHRRLV